MKVERLGKRETPFGLLGFKELKAALAEEVFGLSAITQPPWAYVSMLLPSKFSGGTTKVLRGFAKCMYTDAFDEKRGVAIARGRAVANYAKRLWDNGTKGDL